MCRPYISKRHTFLFFIFLKGLTSSVKEKPFPTSLPWAARRITLALRTSLTPGRETLIRVFDWLSYTRKIWNAVRLQKALYPETSAYKDVRIHHATLNAKQVYDFYYTQRIHRTNYPLYLDILKSHFQGLWSSKACWEKMAQRDRSPLGTRLGKGVYINFEFEKIRLYTVCTP